MDLPDQIVKLLDRGECVVLFRNQMKTYTAAVITDDAKEVVAEDVAQMDDFSLTHTDDFTPGKALHRLSEKMFGTGDYANWPKGGEE